MRIKIIVAMIAAALMFALGWQIAAAEVADINFREEIRDLAAQGGSNVGLLEPKSDAQMCDLVIQKAKAHGIDLQPSQVTVIRTNPGLHSTLYLAAYYSVPISLGVFSFRMHFTPSTNK